MLRRWVLISVLLIFVLPLAADPILESIQIGRTTLEVNAPLVMADRSRFAALVEAFEAELNPLELGMVVSRWTNQGDLAYRIRHNEDEPYAVASAFKALAAYYYFIQTPRDAWDTSPASDIYTMIVYSHNAATADVLAAAAAPDHTANAIQQFNDFTHTVFGLSPQSGLFAWNFGRTAGQRDRRHAPLPTTVDGFVDVRGRRIPVENRYTAADLALALEAIAHIPHEPQATPHIQAAYAATRDLMRVSVPNRIATIDTLLANPNVWRKTGFVAAAEIGVEAHSEIMVIPTTDAGYLVIALLATGEDDTTFTDALAFALAQIRALEPEISF